MWGGRARPRRTPWSGPAITLKTEVDEGVGRSHCAEPLGDRPIWRLFRRTLETGYYEPTEEDADRSKLSLPVAFDSPAIPKRAVK